MDLSREQTTSCPVCGSKLAYDDQSFEANQETQRVSTFDEVIDSRYVERPQRVGRYRVIKHVASGGFGTVYQAYDGVLDQYVAIKIPRRDRIAEAQTETLIQEARMMAKLEHPHIVPVKEAGRDPDGLPYIVMKWIEGPTLKKYLQENEVNAQQAAQIVSQIALAIEFAKSEGVTHRDLKPSNVLIDQQGNALVTDFGLAINTSGLGEHVSELAGTLPYMSPEQLSEGKIPIDHRSDIWSLGVIFYEMLCKERPFNSDSIFEQIKNEDPSELDSAIPTQYSTACLQCLEKDPADRFQSAKDFVDAIASKESESNTNLLIIMICFAVVGLLAGGFGIYSFFGQPKGPQANVKPAGQTKMGSVRSLIFPKGSKLTVNKNLVEIEAVGGDCYVELGSLKQKSRKLSLDMEQVESHSGSGLVLGYKPGFGGKDQEGASFLFFILTIEEKGQRFVVLRQHVNVMKDNIISAEGLGSKLLAPWQSGEPTKFDIRVGNGRLLYYVFGKLAPVRIGKNGELPKGPYNDDSDPGTMKGNHISTNGGFGVYVKKGQRVKISNLMVDGKNVSFIKQ